MGKTKVACVGNGPPDNRGCEAIAHGTAHILREAFGPDTACRNVFFKLPDSKVAPAPADSDLEHCARPLPVAPPRFGLHWLVRVVRCLASRRSYRRAVYGDLLNDVRNASFVLSVGGDNYSLDYGTPRNFIELDRFVRDQGKPLIIWGASVGPFSRDPEFEKQMIRHLQNEVTAIFAREDRTMDYLRSFGFDERLYRMPDPAFLMRPLAPPEDSLCCPLEVAAGMNLSPLMAKFATGGDAREWLDLASGIVAAVLERFDGPVVLIPHVTSSHSDDHAFMARIVERLGAPAALHLLPPMLDARRTKGIIARLRVLVAARMHAAIAGLSSAVPTVSLAYSIKARGVHDDVLGSQEYVLEASGLSAGAVCERIAQALDNEDRLREQLSERMKEVRSEALAAGRKLRELLKP